MDNGGGVSRMMFSMILTYLRSINHGVTTKMVTVGKIDIKAQLNLMYSHQELAKGCTAAM